jgi:hypothetical protein
MPPCCIGFSPENTMRAFNANAAPRELTMLAEIDRKSGALCEAWKSGLPASECAMIPQTEPGATCRQNVPMKH